ncbi:sigma 54-interacting transcriptional regulator [Dyadobacter sp. 3J3]|uniref:sigma-54-dependent Fis family transcriptional regulator n=1 Tax=Dyadobacter sp. 3J3 TaxID=2606600 RepID=UPI001E62DB73|nr:sigma 54-interacting transcriptional regulator [Dyadobacter sp. 3J3]
MSKGKKIVSPDNGEHLALHMAMLKVRNKKQFLSLLNSNLKNLLGYRFTTIFLADPDKTTLINFFPEELTGSDEKIFKAIVKTNVLRPDDLILYEGYSPDGRRTARVTINVSLYLQNPSASQHQNAIELDIYQDGYRSARWIMVYDTEDQILSDHFDHFPSLAPLMAATLINVIENEQMQEREKENEIIQSLNIDFAAIRNKRDLLKIIHFKLNVLFDFSDQFVGVLNNDEFTFSAFLQDVRSWADKHPDYKGSIASKHPVNDRVLNKVIISKEPQLYELSQQVAKGDMPGYFQIFQDVGIKRAILIGLHVADRIIGTWCICQTEYQYITANQLRLIKDISIQLSIAVDNIRANEAILAKQEESKLLLQLSADIANIRDKNHLFNAINRNLKKLFQFEDIVIMVLNEDDTYYAFLFSLAHQSSGYTNYQKTSLKKYSNCDCCFRKVMSSDGIVVLSMEELYQEPSAPDYIKFEYENGIREKVAIKLRDDKKNIGIFYVNASGLGAYTQHELSLIEGVSYQLSTAISNILAAEEIERRESEREMLLSISNDISAVRDNEGIMRVITQKLKHQLAFSHIMIATINDDHSTFSAYVVDPGSKSKHHPFYNEATKTKFPINDGIMDQVYVNSSPLVFDLDELNLQKQMPAYLVMNYESGIKQVIVTRFSKSENVFGFWLICFDTKATLNKNKLSLVSGLANQISIAVSNIIANAEIKRSENEKSQLLSFSNALASVKNKHELSMVFAAEMKKFTIIRDYSLRIITEDKSHHQMFLYDVNAHFTRHPDFPLVRDTHDDINDGITDAVILSDKSITFNVDELCRREVVPRYVKFWKDLGLVENKAMPIRVGDEIIGILWLRLFEDYPSSAEPLLQNICYQIALALSSVLANEQIAIREEEKTFLLSLSNEIASLKSRADLFHVVNARIKHIFSIDQLGMAKINEDGETHSAFMMDLGDSVTGQIDFNEVTSLKYSVLDTAFQMVISTEEPVILIIDELDKEANAPAYVKFWKEVGFKRLLCLALRVGGNPIGTIFFNIKPEEIDKVKHNLLKGICAQLAVAVSNILANEKVLHQLSEINQYKQQLEDEKIYLKEEIDISHNYAEIIGNGPEMQKIFRLVNQVAASDSTVLILGETGTGKELIARAIHNNSPRKNRLMVKVNCATLPANLIESELFGHERGSFTGATERRVGKFELANNGTLFLDEVGEMPLELQVKLLRVLQEQEVERIGGKNTIKVDVRIIAATNRDLEKEMEEGRFRRDLYYRLNIFPISLPPLRSRSEDIPLLSTHFIQRFSKKAGREINKISNSALQELLRYNWPGNIRELEHLIERSVLLSSGDTIRQFQLPSLKQKDIPKLAGEAIALKTIDENERDHILTILKYCKGRVAGDGGAAEILGVPKSTLNSKIKRLGIKREHFY